MKEIIILCNKYSQMSQDFQFFLKALDNVKDYSISNYTIETNDTYYSFVSINGKNMDGRTCDGFLVSPSASLYGSEKNLKIAIKTIRNSVYKSKDLIVKE